MTIRVGFTGGGSGGHIFPLIAVGDMLQRLGEARGRRVTLRYFGPGREFREILEAHNIAHSSISSSKWRRYFSIHNFFDAFVFLFSLIEALWKVFFFMPDVIFSKGGPGALAVILAGRFYRIPVFIHESDAVPGRTNLFSAKFAARVAVGFPHAAQYFAVRGADVAITGNPVRETLLTALPSKSEAARALGIDGSIPLVAVLGGSQGAARINVFIAKHFQDILARYQLIHQTGREQFPGISKLSQEITDSTMQSRYRAAPFFSDDELKNVLVAADVVVGRAGAGTIFEIAAFGKPSVLIPIPKEVVGDHQKANAYAFADAGAAVVIEEENLIPGIFLDQIQRIVTNQELREKMSAAARKFFKPDAARVVAQAILDLVQS